jgi:Zn-finger protein
MKKVLAVALLISAVSASTAFALTFTGTNLPTAGVVASKHNMNLYTENAKDTQGRVCAFCHTPHHASADTTVGQIADYLPLWSHKLTTQESYVPYNSATLNAQIVSPLAGPSLLCMSCHDGVIAVDQHYGGTGSVAAKLNSDGFNGTAVGLGDGVEADFSNDHPIGFAYDVAQGADSGLRVKTSALGSKTIESQLTAGMMTCATCHDVHNKDNSVQTGNPIPTANGNYFLMGDQKDSAFCLGCHIK